MKRTFYGVKIFRFAFMNFEIHLEKLKFTFDTANAFYPVFFINPKIGAVSKHVLLTVTRHLCRKLGLKDARHECRVTCFDSAPSRTLNIVCINQAIN